MATAYSSQAWSELFVASAEASAALASAGFGAILGSSVNAWVLMVEILR
jgi:hypothetical protein